MERVIVTVVAPGGSVACDLELPAELEVRALAPAIARCLAPGNGAGEFRLEACALNRPLRPEETLAGAGVWDGAWLVLTVAT